MRNITIVNNLMERKLLTQTEQEVITANASSNTAFFRTLIRVYEQKVASYITSCHPLIKKHLRDTNAYPEGQLDSKTLQCAMEAVYSVNLQLQPAFLWFSLNLLLKRAAEDLLAALGMEAVTASNYTTVEIVKKFFINFIARERMYNDINSEDLAALCSEADNHSPGLFPSYLFTTFLAQTRFSIMIAEPLSTIPQEQQAQPRASAFATLLQTETENIAIALSALIFYSGSTLQSFSIRQDIRTAHFQHIQARETTRSFSGFIAREYVQQMQQLTRQTENIQDNASILQSRTTAICIPALSLIGITLPDNFDDVRATLQQSRAAVSATVAQKAAIEQGAANYRALLHQNVDQWRSNVQLPEFRMQTGTFLVPF